MIPGVARLIARVLAWQILFSLGAATLIAGLAPHFLLLSGPVAIEGTQQLAFAILAGSLVAVVIGWWRLRRYRYALRALAMGSRSVEPFELYAMAEEPSRLITAWLVPSLLLITVLNTALRPKIVDLPTGITLALFGAVIVAAASLPLFVVVRSAFVLAFENAPPDVMREVVEKSEKRGRIGQRVSRRMIASVTTPVVFLSIGSALIVAAHLRRAGDRNSEETARVLARAVLDVKPGGPAAGLRGAIAQGERLGFIPTVRPIPDGYRVERREDGALSVITPLDEGSAEVTFRSPSVAWVSLSMALVALLGMAIAGSLGVGIGRALNHDLKSATRDVRLLGTDAVMSGGTRVVRSARTRVMARLGLAIERLAARFRVFARAQERAIRARKAAARMRGLFFASVSHDLKSPLNAILGFTELVRKTEQLTPGQEESLALIDRRGRELLALIETILDAARVEAGQLSIMMDECSVHELVSEAIAKGRDLGGEREVELRPEIIEGVPMLHLDRIRMPAAIATFIGHAIRGAPTPLVHLLAAPLDETHVRIDIEVPGPQSSAKKLEALLDPSPMIGGSEHRGLALGLRLARSVIELHGGFVRISNLGNQAGAAVTVVLPVRGVLISSRPSRPPDSLPPPSGPSSHRGPPSSDRH